MAEQDADKLYLLAADAVLLLHVLFVMFVVAGLLLIFIGRFRGWGWVRNPWFRFVHLAAVAVVVLQSWFDVICPLTSIEMSLRTRAADSVYAGSFISHWLEYFLYYRAPAWFFIVAYFIFGVITLLSWFWVRPRSFR